MGGDLDRFMDFTGLIPGADGGTGALDNTYGVPGTGAGGYNAPGSGYDTPQATYGQATYGSGNRVDFDFNIPMDGQVEVNKIFLSEANHFFFFCNSVPRQHAGQLLKK